MQNIFSVNFCCVETTIFTNCSPISLHVILRRASLFSAVYVNSYVKAYGHTTSVHFSLNNVSLKTVLTLVNKNLYVCFKYLVLTRISLSSTKKIYYRSLIITIILFLLLQSKVISITDFLY